MPLIKSKSKAAFSHNVAAEMHAGKPQDQALAIAYSEKRKHMFEGGYAEGGEAEASDDGDNEVMMDHVALECMHAIETKDKEAFLDSFHVLVADILNKLESSEGDEDDVNG